MLRHRWWARCRASEKGRYRVDVLALRTVVGELRSADERWSEPHDRGHTFWGVRSWLMDERADPRPPAWMTRDVRPRPGWMLASMVPTATFCWLISGPVSWWPSWSRASWRRSSCSSGTGGRERRMGSAGDARLCRRARIGERRHTLRRRLLRVRGRGERRFRGRCNGIHAVVDRCPRHPVCQALRGRRRGSSSISPVAAQVTGGMGGLRARGLVVGGVAPAWNLLAGVRGDALVHWVADHGVRGVLAHLLCARSPRPPRAQTAARRRESQRSVGRVTSGVLPR